MNVVYDISLTNQNAQKRARTNNRESFRKICHTDRYKIDVASKG